MSGEKFMLAEAGADRDGEMYVSEHLTFGHLRAAVTQASQAGVPDGAPVKCGYLPDRLANGLYVEKPVDLTKLPFEGLRRLAIKNNPEDSTAAWAEIERRSSYWVDGIHN